MVAGNRVLAFTALLRERPSAWVNAMKNGWLNGAAQCAGRGRCGRRRGRRGIVRPHRPDLGLSGSWNKEAEAGPGENSGATKRAAVTAAAEEPAKSANGPLAAHPLEQHPPVPLGSLHRLVVHTVQRQSKEERATYLGPFGPERVNLGPLD
jgi:hypothetical protein